MAPVATPTLSPIIGEPIFRTPYAVVPAGPAQTWGTAIRRYQKRGRHSEAVLFHDRRAWCVEVQELRREQWAWAKETYGPPTPEQAAHVLGKAMGVLSVFHANPGTPSDDLSQKATGHWITYVLREELMRYMVAVGRWARINCGARIRTYLASKTGRWLDVYQETLWPDAERWPMAVVEMEGGSFLVPLTKMPAAPPPPLPPSMFAKVPVHVQKNQHFKTAFSLLPECWSFAEPDALEMSAVGMESQLYPWDERIRRNTNGQRGVPEWLRAANKKKEQQAAQAVMGPLFD